MRTIRYTKLVGIAALSAVALGSIGSSATAQLPLDCSDPVVVTHDEPGTQAREKNTIDADVRRRLHRNGGIIRIYTPIGFPRGMGG